MIRFSVFALPATLTLLAGCTLTPSHFDGYDLLDTGHKTENQDPVAVPVKEQSDLPRVKVSPKKVEPPVFAKPADIKPTVKAEEKKEAKPVEPPVAKKSEPKIEEKKTEVIKTETETKVVKVEEKKQETIKSDPCLEVNNGVSPPPRPDAKAETLKSGDRVKITVFRERDLTGNYQINDKGMITFPLIGQVQGAGVTPSQLQSNLVEALSKGYLVKPDVSVSRLPDCKSK